MDELNRQEDRENLKQIPLIQYVLKDIGGDVKELKESLKPLVDNMGLINKDIVGIKKDVGWLNTATKSLYGILVTIIGGVGIWAIVAMLKR
jgi:hypothetical protein